MANTGNTQQQIDYGAAANDGQGDPLRTAFIKTDDNFDAIWNTGPVGSNITILNNTVQSNNTNGNIVIRPNGVGIIQANASILPNTANLRDLGSTGQRWRAAYIGSGGLSVDGNVTVTGNLTAGNISYTGNVFVGDLQGSVYADDSTIMVDAVDNAVFADSATFALANISGNVTANYFIGNGSQLTGITSSYGNANVVANLAALGNNFISTTGNVTANYFVGNGSLLTGITSYANANVLALGEAGWSGNIIPSANAVYSLGNATNYWSNLWVANNTIYIGGVPLGVTGNVLTVNGEPVLSNDSNSSITTTGNITADYFFGNGSQLTGLSTSSISNGNSNVEIATANGNVTVTAASTQTWRFDTNGDLTVPNYINFKGNTYIGDEPGSGSPAFRIVAPLTYGATIETDSDISGNSWTWTFGADGVLGAPGNITANSFIGDGSQLTGLPDGTAIVNGTSQIDIPTANGNIYVGVNNVGSTEFTALGINTLTLAALANITAAGTITATGNLSAGNISTAGNITATGNVSADRILTNSLLSETDVFVQALDGLVDIRANGNVVIKSADANYEWLFDDAGVLTTAGDIVVNGGLELSAGIVTTATNSSLQAANGGLLSLSSTDSNTTSESAVRVYVDTADNANNRVYIYTDNQGTGDLGTWTFAPDGTLTLPGDTAFMDASANFVGIYPDASQNNGIELYTTNTEIFNDGNVNISANVAGTGKTWTFANTGDLTAPGAISATRLQNDANLEIRSNVAGTARTWTFDTLGDLNLPVGGNISGSGGISANNITLTGNITAANFIGNVSLTGNITGTSANVELVAGSYTWTFDNTGNTAFANGTVSANDITLTGNISATVNGYDIGYREIPQVALSANANAALSDSGKHFYSTTAGNLVILIPTNANVAFPTGSAFTVVVQAAGNVLVNADAGVTLYMAGSSSAGNRTVGAYGMATVMKVATDTWFINGTGVY